MKIDAETLKKQVILHLPYVLFLLVFAKLGEAVRLAPGADASQKLLGLSEGFALAFQSMWPGAAMDWLVSAVQPLCGWQSILEGKTLRNTAKMWNMVLQDGEIKPILPRLWTQIRKTISFLPKVKD
jgi:hypothetical protein